MKEPGFGVLVGTAVFGGPEVEVALRVTVGLDV
jgi:hypothetical protein